MCEPERTFSGFRCNLIKCVETVSYFLFGTKERNGQRVDICGDGCEIGGVETTPIAFRILTDKKSVNHQMQYSVLLHTGVKIVGSQWSKTLDQLKLEFKSLVGFL